MVVILYSAMVHAMVHAPMAMVHAPARFAATPRVSAAMMSKVIRTYAASDLPSQWPFTAEDMRRIDESPDISFYDQPRFVTHIDDAAIAAITSHYREVLTPGADVLDLCSSWVSHLPEELELGRVAGVGMNARELEANPRLTEFVQADLNADPTLRFADASFDAVLNVVSVDYLSSPRKVFAEMHRVPRPGGVATMSFSNRMFATKAVAVWLDSDDAGRQEIVATYFATSPEGGWEAIEVLDARAGRGAAAAAAGGGGLLAGLLGGLGEALSSAGDPMYVVQARKRA